MKNYWSVCRKKIDGSSKYIKEDINMLDERWVFHDDVKAEQAGEGVIRRVLALSLIHI